MNDDAVLTKGKMNDVAVLLKKTKWMMMLWNIKQMAIDEMNDVLQNI